MRRVAQELGCAAMSLYEHVENKDVLLDLMADHAIAWLPELDPAGDWRAEMRRFFTAFHELYLEHPAVAYVMVHRPLAGPNTLRRGEPALQALLRAGFDDAAAVEAFTALGSYTVGASLYELARRDADRSGASRRFATLSATDFPTVQRLAAHLTAAAGAHQFHRGLTRLLDSYDPAP
jgi:AcrR family transcriptional regulator